MSTSTPHANPVADPKTALAAGLVGAAGQFAVARFRKRPVRRSLRTRIALQSGLSALTGGVTVASYVKEGTLTQDEASRAIAPVLAAGLALDLLALAVSQRITGDRRNLGTGRALVYTGVTVGQTYVRKVVLQKVAAAVATRSRKGA